MSGVVGTPQVLSPDLMWLQDIDLSVSTSMKCFNLSSWTEQRQNISLLQILRLVWGKQSYSYYLLFSWSLKHKTHLDANSSSDQHFNSSWEKCFCWRLQLRCQWDKAVQHSVRVTADWESGNSSSSRFTQHEPEVLLTNCSFFEMDWRLWD